MSVRSTSVSGGLKAVVVLLFAALFFFGLQAPAANASVPVDVTISVKTKAGTPLAGLSVYAYPVANHAVTGPGIVGSFLQPGVYSLAGLTSASQYAFYFDAPASATTAFDQYWGGTTFVEEARYWDYSDGTKLDVTLATNSTVTGKVTGLSSRALSGIAVYPWRFDGNRWFRLDAAKATTSSTGIYTMRNLEPGTYRLEFAPSNLTGYLSEFSGNTAVFGSAAAVTLGLGATVSYSASLAVGGSISGAVRIFAEGDEYLPYGITAYAYRVDPNTGAIDLEHAYPSRATTSTGKWVVSGLPSGQYKVKLYDTDTFSFVDIWAGGAAGASSVSTATAYSVTAGKTTAISGTPRLDFYTDLPDTSLVISATDAASAPLGLNADLYIESLSGEDFYFQSDSQFGLENGTLYLPFMPVGDYRVWIDPHDSISQPYIADTWHIAAQSGGNTWNIHLAARGAFTYSAPATPNITTPTVGTAYTINRGHTDLDDGSGTEAPVSYSYIWLRDQAPIFGSQSDTSSSYTSRGVDLGHKLSVIVRADSFGYAPVFTTIDLTAAATPGPAPANLTLPSISGPASAVPGSVLTANPGTWDQPGLSFSYQWADSSGDIALATGRTYTVGFGEANEDITVRVVANRTGYTSSTPATSPVPKPIGILPAPKLVKASTISAVTLAGGDIKFTATAGTWSPAPEGVTYAWFVDGGFPTMGNPFTCAAAVCAGKSIELEVNVNRTGYLAASKRYVVRKGTAALSAPTGQGVADQTTPAAIGSGDPAQIGHILKVTPQTYTYPNGAGIATPSYQWLANGAVIKGATKQTYVPTTTVLNKVLSVRVTVTSTLFPTGTVIVPGGTVRYKQDLVIGPTPTFGIDGTGVAGATKRLITIGSWPVSAVTQSYQWYRCVAADCSGNPVSNTGWLPIAGALASTYTPPATTPDGTRLMARVVGSKSGYQAVLLYTSPFTINTAADPNDVMAFSTPSYVSGLSAVTTGNATVARAIVVKSGVIDRPIALVNQWQVCNDASCSSPVAIPGATLLTYTPAASLLADGVPHWIRLKQSVPFRFDLLTAPVPLVAGSWALVKTPALTTSVPAVGVTRYTAGGGTWPVGVAPTLEYAWHDGDPATVAGTQPSYDVTTGSLGAVWVVVTAKRTGYADLTFTLVARKGTLPAQTPALSGAVYGDALHLAAPLNIPVNVPSATLKYQWYSGATLISGAIAATYTPPAAYVGKSLTLRTTVTSPFYATATVISAPVVLAAHNPAFGTPVIVSTPGTFAPGAKLTVNTSAFPAGMTYTYSWQISANGVNYSQVGTASSYIVKTTDPTLMIRVMVTVTHAGWLPSTNFSVDNVINYTPGLSLTSPFLLGGTGRVDTAITAPTTWDTTGMVLAYRWTRNGVTIPGATGSTIVPTASWIGDEVQAHVTATKAGYLPRVVDSNEVQVTAGVAPTSTALTISPVAAKVGVPVTVSSGVWTVAGVTLTYAWYLASDTAHASALATTATYTPVGTQPLVAVVTAHRAGYLDGTASKAITVVP